MHWFKKIYTGDSLKGKSRYYRYLITYAKKVTGTYCIVLSESGQDLLEIYHGELMHTPFMEMMNPLIIGIAGSRREAYELSGQIILDIYQQTGGTDVHAYFNQKN